jgi:hypothetical protein
MQSGFVGRKVGWMARDNQRRVCALRGFVLVVRDIKDGAQMEVRRIRCGIRWANLLGPGKKRVTAPHNPDGSLFDMLLTR